MSDVSSCVDTNRGEVVACPVDYTDPDQLKVSSRNGAPLAEAVGRQGRPDEVVVLGPDHLLVKWKKIQAPTTQVLETEAERCGGLDDDCTDGEKQEIYWRNVRPQDVVVTNAVTYYTERSLPGLAVDGFLRLLGINCSSPEPEPLLPADAADTSNADALVDTVCTVFAGGKTLACDGDEDGDLIPNDKDKCPTEYGPNSNKGCPETPVEDASVVTDSGCEQMSIGDKQICKNGDDDQDQLQNQFDNCPFEFGPVWNKGCPVVDVPDAGGKDTTDEVQEIEVNQPPSFKPIANQTVKEGEKLEFTVEATDPDGDVVTYETIKPKDLPKGVQFDETSGLFQWTPDFSQAGFYSINFWATAGGQITMQTVKITVINVDQPPVLQPIEDKTVKEGEELKFSISATDPDGNAVTYAVDPLPKGAQFNQTTGLFQWKPDFTQSGSHPVTFSASAGGQVTTQMANINVLNVDQAPMLQPLGDKTVMEGEKLEFSVSATDPDGDIVIYAIDPLPKGAQFNQTTGLFQWVPDFSQSGNYGVTFSAISGTQVATQKINIAVLNVNQAPVLAPIGDKLVNTGENLSFTILGTDPDGDTITYGALSLPQGATLNSKTGLFQWKPDYDQNGSYQVTFTANDGMLEDMEQISITVKPSFFIKQVNISTSGVELEGGCNNPVISADGQKAAFTHDDGIYVHNLKTLETALVEGKDSWLSYKTRMSSLVMGGTLLAFESVSSTLVPLDTNNQQDVFVKDLTSGAIERVSMGNKGEQLDIKMVIDPGTVLELGSSLVGISQDGRYVAFYCHSDIPQIPPLFLGGGICVRDRLLSTTKGVMGFDGKPPNGGVNETALSPDGRFLAFTSSASNLITGVNLWAFDYYPMVVYDRVTETSELFAVSSDGSSYNPAFSADGRYIAFESEGSDLVLNDNNNERDVFVYDQMTKKIELVSVASDGTQANGWTFGGPSISTDGRYVAFTSWASNLVPGDTNDEDDIFVHDRVTGATKRVSVGENNVQVPKGNSNFDPCISANGKFLAFKSTAPNFVPGNTNYSYDAYVVGLEYFFSQ